MFYFNSITEMKQTPTKNSNHNKLIFEIFYFFPSLRVFQIIVQISYLIKI